MMRNWLLRQIGIVFRHSVKGIAASHNRRYVGGVHLFAGETPGWRFFAAFFPADVVSGGVVQGSFDQTDRLNEPQSG